jgi:uncharacterized protein
MEDLQQRKLLSALCHGSIFFSSTLLSVAIPIVILVVTQDSVVKQNARESLNFHINIYLCAIICIPLIFVLIGIPLLILIGIFSLIMPVIAIVRVLEDTNTAYSYPFIFRVI